MERISLLLCNLSLLVCFILCSCYLCVLLSYVGCIMPFRQYITGVIYILYGTNVYQRSEPRMWSQFLFLKDRVLTQAPDYTLGFIVILETAHGHTPGLLEIGVQHVVTPQILLLGYLDSISAINTSNLQGVVVQKHSHVHSQNLKEFCCRHLVMLFFVHSWFL